MWVDPHSLPCPLEKVLFPGLRVQMFTVVTCYDPIHLLQGCCQHLASVRHHLVFNCSEREDKHKKKGKLHKGSWLELKGIKIYFKIKSLPNMVSAAMPAVVFFMLSVHKQTLIVVRQKRLKSGHPPNCWSIAHEVKVLPLLRKSSSTFHQSNYSNWIWLNRCLTALNYNF